MAAAAGRSLLLLLSSRGRGGGAGGCGALTAGYFSGLGVSRHRQQQHHRTVSERARRLRGGRGGAGVWEPPAGRPPGQLASYLNSRPLPRLPGTEKPPCPSGACGGDQEGRESGGSREEEEEEEEGRRRDVPAGLGTQGVEGMGLEPLTDPPPISVRPSFLTALPLCTRTEPRTSYPLSFLLWVRLGVLSCRGCLVCVRRVALPCFWELSPESNPGPLRGPLSSLGALGMNKKENQTLSPSVTSCTCGFREQLPCDGCCIASGGKLHPLRSLKVLGGPFGGLVLSLFARV